MVTMLLALGLVLCLAAGVGAAVLVPKPAAAGCGQGGHKNLPLPVFCACAVCFVALCFWQVQGYALLGGIVGEKTAHGVFLALHVAMPLLAAAVCAAYAVKSRAQLRFVLCGWGCLVQAALGVASLAGPVR